MHEYIEKLVENRKNLLQKLISCMILEMIYKSGSLYIYLFLLHLFQDDRYV